MALSQRKYNTEELNGADKPLRLQHRFLVLRKLGQGTYGKVQLALNKETNQEVAVKTIKKAKIGNEEDMLRIRREIYIMTAIRHPHIIHINEVFETRQKIVIVMQYASGGELYDYLGCHQTLPEDEARRIFRQIASAIYYCHKNQICHRDLKLENILLDEEGNAKIADFGLSNIFDDKRRMNTFCGSPLYASPEIVKGTPYKGPEVDCWSLGVLLYTLVYGTMPFDGRSFKELVSQIAEGRYDEPINKSNASSLIRWLLTPEISRRATITDVCKDEWVNHGYETSLLEIAENLASTAGVSRVNSNKQSLETNTKNGKEKSIFRKAAEHLEEKAGKFTSMFAKNLEDITKTNDSKSEARKCTLYEQITNYDVRFVLNKLLAAVEASFNSDKNVSNLAAVKSLQSQVCSIQARKDISAQKVDSAYVIPIFEVTSIIPKERYDKSKTFNGSFEENIDSKVKDTYQKTIIQRVEKILPQSHIKKQESSNDACKQYSETYSEHRKNTSKPTNVQKLLLSVEGESRNKTLLTDSQKQFYTLDISGHPDSHKADLHNRKLKEQELSVNRNPPQKAKKINDGFAFGQKHPGPFMKTKHHVLSLARLLSLNYEKLMRNSFRVPKCTKKLPGKITIPATFDPNNPPTTTKKRQDEKKELLIFPTVSVSENKEKIEKKIEKIKKAALNKNIIIRSDSKTRLRIEKYILSQVKKIQDLVCEDQRSIHASLEHLEEQSFRDMSEMYYCTFGSENTDSGIANTEDEEYFCFLCSKPNESKGTSNFVDSFVIDSIKNGNLYTSNHLHIPRGKAQNKWSYATTNSNAEFGALSRCKSEIKFPSEYLNYISPSNKSELNNKTNQNHQLRKNSIGNTKCFLALSSLNADDSNLGILRSASDSVGLHLCKDSFEIVKLNTNGHDDILLNYSEHHFLEQTSPSSGCNYSQMTGNSKIQSSRTSKGKSRFNMLNKLEKDDGIGDSNDSFQSYMEIFEGNLPSTSTISESKSLHSFSNFSKENFNANHDHVKRLLSEPYIRKGYDSENENVENDYYERGTKSVEKCLDADNWEEALQHVDRYDQYKGKTKGLRRRNTVTCIRDKGHSNEHFNFDQASTEFENYLWNTYKDHLLETTQSDTEFSNSPRNLNYYSLDRRTKSRHKDSKSLDFINGERSNGLYSMNIPNCESPSEESETNDMTLRNILKHTNVSNYSLEGTRGRLTRAKSLASEIRSENERDDVIRKLKTERKLSQGSCSAYDANNGMRTTFFSNFLNDLEKKDKERKASKDLNRKRYSKNNVPVKRSKSEYKKSFLQLLALKRIQEAEKELDKSHRNNLLDVEEENSGSLLEALKTHGYKGVISQRFQDTNADDLYSSHMTYMKSPRNLRAELAQLNYMYYESLPRYTLDSYEENDYFYDDLEYSRNVLNGYASPSYYEINNDFRQKLPKQSIYDWLNTTQTDEYLRTIRPDAVYTTDETISDARKFCTQWGKENSKSFDDESTSESLDTTEESNPSNMRSNGFLRNKEQSDTNAPTNYTNFDTFQMNSTDTDDEKRESVHDRIWRKSFYSRFNNRALSRKERSAFVEQEFLSESRLGLLNNLYNPAKSGYDRTDVLQWDGSNKSFQVKKRPKKHSASFDKFESSTSLKKKHNKLERDTLQGKSPSLSRSKEITPDYNSTYSDNEVNTCNTTRQSEEPQPDH